MTLYNKYRPARLADVVGQQHVREVLESQVRSNSLVHAYLFTGPAGTGKTTVARLLAAMVNCSSGMTSDPPQDDEIVRLIMSGSKSSTDIIEIDAATNRKIDDVRALRESLQYAPAMLRKKVVILDECHQLTSESWEALLKILEEPPPYVMFVLCTTEPQSVTETVKTRCMMLDFRPLASTDIAGQLVRICESEGIKASQEALSLLATMSEGSLRMAISRLEKLRHIDGGITPEKVTQHVGIPSRVAPMEFVSAVISRDFMRGLSASSSVISAGISAFDFVSAVAKLCHDITVCAVKGYDLSVHGYSNDEIEQVKGLRASVGAKVGKDATRLVLQGWVDVLDQNAKTVVFNRNPQFQADLAFAAMVNVLVRATPPTIQGG